MPRSLKAFHTTCYAPDISSESSLYGAEQTHDILSVLSRCLGSTKYFPPRSPVEYNNSFEDPYQWSDSSPLATEFDSTGSSPDTWSSLSQSPYDVPIDENNYLTWSYDVSDIHPSLYAPSAQHANPASPSMSVMSASTEDSVLSPLPSLADFGNVLDFDFCTSLPNEAQPSASSHQWLQINHQHSHPSKHQPFLTPSCPSPAHTSASAEGSESRPGLSREPSPNQSDNDQNNPRRRYPCLILGCTRRFTSQYTLKVHMEAHKPKPRVSFPCTMGCPEKFSRQHDRLRHEVAKHGKVCEFSCDECGRFFSTKKTLGNHKCPMAQGTRWVDT